MDGLFFLNLVVVAVFLFRSRHHPLRLLVAVLNIGAEIVVTGLIWFFDGLSVSGFYF